MTSDQKTQLRGGTASHVVNLSAGQALSSYPVIASALAILRLARRRVEWTEVSTLVRDPYLAGASEERTARGLLDARLRLVR